MNSNIFKRVAELEQQVKDLRDFNIDNSIWFARLGERTQKLESANQVLVNSNQALIGRHENIGKRLKDLEHQVYTQSRESNSSTEVLKQQVKDLTDLSSDHGLFIGKLDNKLNQTNNKLLIQEMAISKAGLAPDPLMPVFTEAEVDQEKEWKRQYQREWYAKRQAKLKQEKNVQAAREKKNAYHRAYYARKKAESK